MFGHSYFGQRYYGDAYFGDGGEGVAGGGDTPVAANRAYYILRKRRRARLARMIVIFLFPLLFQ